MKFNKLIYLIVPILTLANGNPPDNSVEIGDNGTGIIVRHSERATRPGGFSAVAEPAGPVDPEAAKRAAEEYARKCIEPKILAIASMGLIPGPPQECAAQVNTGAPLAAGPTTISNEQVKQTFNITLLGTAIEVEATPVSFNWDWGDGQTFDTTDPGTPYPNYSVSHPYEVTGNGYVIRLRTSWSARWRIAGQGQWHQVNGTVTTTESSTCISLIPTAPRRKRFSGHHFKFD